ncbi:MAG: hypothetical protein OT477_13010 [Chloroflexi bacterium]|nr:hypothetical protein [Chloroflexota bacterium]
MPKHPPIGSDNVKIVPYSASPKYHLFLSLLSNEKFGKPSASHGLRQAVRELSKLPEFADLWTEAQRLAATGESLPKMPSKGAAIFALHEIHVFLLLLPWREVEEMDGSLGLQMVILRIAEHEPYKRVWNQIKKGKEVNVDVPKRIPTKDVSGGRPVDYSCSAQMHDFLNWLGEGNRPQGVRRAIYALAKKDPAIDEYLREAEVIGEKTRQIIESLADDPAALDAFSQRTGLEFGGKKQTERKIIEWGIFDAVGLERELDRL